MTLTRRKGWLASALDACGVPRALGALSRWEGLLVLNYHRIGACEETDLDRGVFSCTTDNFARQMEHIRQRHHVLRLADLEAWFTERNPSQAVLITFDDGYEDNYTLAFPILKDLGLTAAFFPATGFIDERTLAWWDELAWMIHVSPRTGLPRSPWWEAPLTWGHGERETTIRRVLRAYKQASSTDAERIIEFVACETGSGRGVGRVEAPWMTWKQLQEMVAAGMEIGAHTVSHPILSHLSPAEQWAELTASKRRLEEKLELVVNSVSYPVGQTDSFDEASRSLVAQAGYRWAFSFYGGYTNGTYDPFDLRRIAIDDTLGLGAFRCLTQVPHLFVDH